MCTIVLPTFLGYIQVGINFFKFLGIRWFVFLHLWNSILHAFIGYIGTNLLGKRPHVSCALLEGNGFSNKMALVSRIIDFADVTISRCRLFSLYSSIHIVVESACLFVGWLVLGSTVILFMFLISDKLRETW